MEGQALESDETTIIIDLTEISKEKKDLREMERISLEN